MTGIRALRSPPLQKFAGVLGYASKFNAWNSRSIVMRGSPKSAEKKRGSVENKKKFNSYHMETCV